MLRPGFRHQPDPQKSAKRGMMKCVVADGQSAIRRPKPHSFAPRADSRCSKRLIFAYDDFCFGTNDLRQEIAIIYAHFLGHQVV